MRFYFVHNIKVDLKISAEKCSWNSPGSGGLGHALEPLNEEGPSVLPKDDPPVSVQPTGSKNNRRVSFGKHRLCPHFY